MSRFLLIWILCAASQALNGSALMRRPLNPATVLPSLKRTMAPWGSLGREYHVSRPLFHLEPPVHWKFWGEVTEISKKPHAMMLRCHTFLERIGAVEPQELEDAPPSGKWGYTGVPTSCGMTTECIFDMLYERGLVLGEFENFDAILNWIETPTSVYEYAHIVSPSLCCRKNSSATLVSHGLVLIKTPESRFTILHAFVNNFTLEEYLENEATPSYIDVSLESITDFFHRWQRLMQSSLWDEDDVQDLVDLLGIEPNVKPGFSPDPSSLYMQALSPLARD